MRPCAILHSSWDFLIYSRADNRPLFAYYYLEPRIRQIGVLFFPSEYSFVMLSVVIKT